LERGMSFLRGGGGNNSQIPVYTSLQVQTSSAAVPIQIVYGCNKVAPNCFWTGNFLYTEQKSGGKGGGKITGYTYTVDVMFGLCEGPINAVGGVWNNNSITYMWNLGLGLFYGAADTAHQHPWSYLTSTPQFQSQALNYLGLAYTCAAAFYLGSSPNLPALSFDVHGLLVGTGLLAGNEWDASPALVIQDFLTSAQYGVGFPAASIDSVSLLTSAGGASSYQTYCQAAYLGISPLLSNQEAANSIIARWLQLTNAAVWSGGKLKIIPYADMAISGSGASFAPNTTPVYNLTDDDFIHSTDEDPVLVSRSDPYEANFDRDLAAGQRLRRSADSGVGSKRDRALWLAHGAGHHRARDLRLWRRRGRRSAAFAAQALCPQHLFLQAVAGLLPARADGFGDDLRFGPRPQQRRGAHHRSRRR
jgi:Putative phage tail protein